MKLKLEVLLCSGSRKRNGVMEVSYKKIIAKN